MVTTRIGNLVRSLVSLVLETLAIGTETIKVAAVHLDGFLDDLNEEVKP